MSEPTHATRPGLLAAGSPLRTALLVLLAYAVLGAVAGVVWQWIWTPPGQVVQQHHLFYDGYASLRRVFTGTGLYVLVGAAASALVALATCVLARGRELLVLFLVVVGSAVGAALMWQVGTLLAPGDPTSVAAHAATGTHVSGQLTVAGSSPYLVWPMASLFVLALVYFAWPGSFVQPRHAEPAAADHSEADIPGAQRG